MGKLSASFKACLLHYMKGVLGELTYDSYMFFVADTYLYGLSSTELAKELFRNVASGWLTASVLHPISKSIRSKSASFCHKEAVMQYKQQMCV
jgi:hypothetical protein